jgi:hypothetical protein
VALNWLFPYPLIPPRPLCTSGYTLRRGYLTLVVRAGGDEGSDGGASIPESVRLVCARRLAVVVGMRNGLLLRLQLRGETPPETTAASPSCPPSLCQPLSPHLTSPPPHCPIRHLSEAAPTASSPSRRRPWSASSERRHEEDQHEEVYATPCVPLLTLDLDVFQRAAGEKLRNRREFGWEMAHAAVSRRPPIPPSTRL